jgi:hypothetical protein
MDEYLFRFICDEIRLQKRDQDVAQVAEELIVPSD